MRFAWFVVAIFAGRFFATAVYFPPIDGDLSWQRWLGERIATTASLPDRLGQETFTAVGAPWVPQEWLFSILAYRTGVHGWFWLALACAACATLALALCGWRAQRLGASPAGVAVAVSATGIALLASFGVRAQVVAWPLLAAFVLLLEIDGSVSYFAIAVAVLWSNVHASVMLAPVLAGIFFAGTLVNQGWNANARRYAFISAGCALATLANPLGWKLPLYAVSLLSSPFKSMIVEWKSTDLGDQAFAYGAFPLVLCLLAFGVHGAHRWRDRLLLGTVAWLMFSAARNISVFALVASPIVAVALTAAFADSRTGHLAPRVVAVPRALRIAESFAALAISVFIGGMLARAEASGAVPDTQPHRALAAIEALPGRSNVFCANFTWCSFLLGSPRVRVFLDGRADPYPSGVWDDYSAIIRVVPAWQATLARRCVDVVLLERTSALEQAISLSGEWRSSYSDGTFRAWVRSNVTSLPKDCRRLPRASTLR